MRRNAWASLHLLGQRDSFLAEGGRQIDIVYLSCQSNLVWNNGCTKENVTAFSLQDCKDTAHRWTRELPAAAKKGPEPAAGCAAALAKACKVFLHLKR